MNYDKRLISCVRAFLYFFLLLRNVYLNLDIIARVAKIEHNISQLHTYEDDIIEMICLYLVFGNTTYANSTLNDTTNEDL